MARASGIESDTRKLGYEAYGDAEFDIITSTDCDGYARCPGYALASCFSPLVLSANWQPRCPTPN